MKQKKKIFILIVGTFLLAFPFHFVYDTIPSTITSIFFPVNESIWEHMKLLFTTYLAFGAIEYPLLKHWKLNIRHELFTLWLGAILVIPIFLMMYMPLYWMIGEQMIVTFILMFIAFTITKIIQFFIKEKMEPIKTDTTIITIILIILCYIAFGLLTYFPMKTSLFFDVEHKKYGIQTYQM